MDYETIAKKYACHPPTLYTTEECSFICSEHDMGTCIHHKNTICFFYKGCEYCSNMECPKRKKEMRNDE
jgi:hypothetical protein